MIHVSECNLFSLRDIEKRFRTIQIAGRTFPLHFNPVDGLSYVFLLRLKSSERVIAYHAKSVSQEIFYQYLSYSFNICLSSILNK